MTTVADLVTDVIGLAQGQFRPNYDVLESDINASTTAVSIVHDIWSFAAGDWIEVGEEPMQVLTKTSNDLTVIRGITSYAGESHTAGELVSIKPQFLRSEIIQYIKGEILALPNTVFATEANDVTFGVNASYAELSTTLDDHIDVVAAWKDPNSDQYEPLKRVRLILIRDLDTGVSSTGLAVQIAPTPAYFDTSTVVRVVTSHRFNTSTFTKATNLESAVGLSPNLVEAVKFGAAYRALMQRSSARTQLDTAGPSRDAEEVQGNVVMQTAEGFRRTRAGLIAAEASRLRGMYGIIVQ